MIRILFWLCALLCASQSFAYVRTTAQDGSPIRWLERDVYWFLHKSGTQYLPFTELEPAARASFETWNAVECSDFLFHYEGTTDDDHVGYLISGENANVVRFVPADQWDNDSEIAGLTTVTYCLEKQGRLCPFVGRILDSDMELNESFHFTTSSTEPQFDIQNTITHEVGHILGLEHAPDPESTMFASAPYGELSKRSLSQDDIDGICAIYPKGVPDPEAPSYENDGCSLTRNPRLPCWMLACFFLLPLGLRKSPRPFSLPPSKRPFI